MTPILALDPAGRSHGRPDIVVRPDADMVGVNERLSAGGGLRLYFKRGDAVDYWTDEELPAVR